ncbi:MAG: hypothetical protein QXK51_03675 [Candidatus Methanomethylicia archaeon]
MLGSQNARAYYTSSRLNKPREATQQKSEVERLSRPQVKPHTAYLRGPY